MTDTDLHAVRHALLELSPTQQIAVEALAGGATQQEAAQAAGVARETVTRWAGHSPSFRATLNLYRASVLSEQLDTARRIRGKALSAVEVALDKGDIDPLAVLRAVVEVPTAIGPTLPEAVLDEEMNSTRATLPPVPPPRTVEEQLESMANPGPSEIERAEEATLARLAAASGLDDRGVGGPARSSP